MIRKIIRNILEESIDSFLNEIGEFNYNKTFIPPTDVVNVCKNAISTTGSKLEKAIELSNGTPQSFNQIKKLRDFFVKNESNKDQNWNLHGGDACKKWVERELEKFHDNNLRTKGNLRAIGGAGEKKGMGTMDTRMMDTNKGRNNIR